MTSKPISLQQFYTQRLFRVPDYQRGYAWKHEHLNDFWEDLINLQDNHVHYTGLISLRVLPKNSVEISKYDTWLLESGYTYTQIIDGQQRLTTFSIFIFELLKIIKDSGVNEEKKDDDIVIGYERLKDIKRKYIAQSQPPHEITTSFIFGYESDNPSVDYLKHKIFESSHSGSLLETYYTKNLEYAKTFFATKLNEVYKNHGIKELERLYKKITQQMMVNVYEIEEDYDVFVAFETMNNRGKKLTSLELLKNRLIYLTTLFSDIDCPASDKATMRKNINDTWKEIYYQIGRNSQNSLSDDEFLRAHWYVHFQYTRKRGDDYFKFLMSRFSYKSIYENGNGIEIENDVLSDDSFEDEVEIENINVDFKLSPRDINLYVDSLKTMAQYWYYSFYPKDFSGFSPDGVKWIDRLNRVGISYFRPLVCVALLKYQQSSNEEFLKLVKSIERCIFLFFRIARFQASYKSSEFTNLARGLNNRETTFTYITNLIEDAIENEKATIINSFIANMKRRFTNDSGYYSWSDIKYFLFEYEYHLLEKYSTQKIEWEHFSKNPKDMISVEHILPQTPSKWYWKNQFRDYTQEEIKLLSGSLGNLLPLSQSINSSLQNDGFDEKKNVKKGRRGYSNGSHSEIEVSKYDNWTARNIFERGIKLLEFLEKRWDIKFTRSEKLELLNIDFVNDLRIISPELTISDTEIVLEKKDREVTVLERRQYEFWEGFKKFCHDLNRFDRVSKYKSGFHNWYDVNVESNRFHIFFQALKSNKLRIGLYIYGNDNYEYLLKYKEDLSNVLSFELLWDKSKLESNDKRIYHDLTEDVLKVSDNTVHYQWLLNRYDELLEKLTQLNLIENKE